MEIDLTPAQRLEIETRCLEAVRGCEETHSKLRPYGELRKEIVGDNGLKWTAIVFGLFIGLVSLAVWRWALDAFGIDEILRGIGVPSLVVSNLPEGLALMAAAFASWMVAYAWGVEGRAHFATRAFNAHDRSSVLHSVCEELSEILPDAIPDLDDFANAWEDDRPHHFVEIALGRHKGDAQKPVARRRDPSLSGK